MPSLSSLENHTRSIPVFRPNRRKHPTLRGDTFLFGLYKGGPQAQVSVLFFLSMPVLHDLHSSRINILPPGPLSGKFTLC